jgi:hypothetical protein
MREYSGGSARNPSEPARLALIPGERHEMMLQIVLPLDLDIHNEWPS